MSKPLILESFYHETSTVRPESFRYRPPPLPEGRPPLYSSILGGVREDLRVIGHVHVGGFVGKTPDLGSF